MLLSFLLKTVHTFLELNLFTIGKLALVKYDAVETLKDEAAAWTAEGNFVEAVENVLAFATAAIDADTVADADAVSHATKSLIFELKV